MKLGPFFTAFGHVARQLDRARADGLVLFNRFYQPDIDVLGLTVVPHLELSTSAELLLRLQWLSALHGQVRCSLAVTGGVATPVDGIKSILAGAHAVQLVSAHPSARARIFWRDARGTRSMDGIEVVLVDRPGARPDRRSRDRGEPLRARELYPYASELDVLKGASRARQRAGVDARGNPASRVLRGRHGRRGGFLGGR